MCDNVSVELMNVRKFPVNEEAVDLWSNTIAME